MSTYPIVQSEGLLTDEKYSHSFCCLVFACNAVSCDAVGVGKDIARLYPYGDLYKDRRRLYTLSRCVRPDRDALGVIKIRKPPAGEDKPYIVGFVSQFSAGSPVQDNEFSRHYIDTSIDVHFVDGLKIETKERRLEAFKECMKKLTIFIMGNSDIHTIVIPAGLSVTGGTANDSWKNDYLPIIQGMATRLQPYGVTVEIVHRKSE